MLTDEERSWYAATRIDAPWPEARKVIHTLLDRLEAERARAAVDQDMEALHDRMVDLLTRTANALKGDPAEIGEHGGMHSWHDLPEMAAEAQRERRANLDGWLASQARLVEIEDALSWDTTCLNCASLLDKSYAQYIRAEKLEAAVRALSVELDEERLSNGLPIAGGPGERLRALMGSEPDE